MRNERCIHITHNDGDAVGCALVAAIYFPNYDFLNNTYFCPTTGGSDKLNELLDNIIENGKELPEIIIISDLSLNEETCERLESIKKDNPDMILFGVDHHSTNLLNNKFSWYNVKNEKVYDINLKDKVLISACKYMLEILWKFVNPNEFNMSYSNKLSILINSISRYDTWEWKHHPYDYGLSFNDDMIAVICDFIGPKETFTSLLTLYDKYRTKGCGIDSRLIPDIFEEIYESCIASKNKYLSTIEKRTKILKTKVYTVAYIIHEGNYSNAACDYLYTKYPQIDTVVVLYPTNCKLSLRTNKPEINVGEFCKKYLHGGGHVSAAGGECSPTKFVKLLDLFYNKMVWLSDYKDSIESIEPSGISIVDFFNEV